MNTIRQTISQNSTWTAPAGVTVLNLISRRKTGLRAARSNNKANLILAPGGIAYAWGQNTNGNLGVGDVTPRSSPVAVLGGLVFSEVFSQVDGTSFFGKTPTGQVYAWGLSTSGQLGLGGVTPVSSPVAVLGGFFFQTVIAGWNSGGGSSVHFLTPGGAAYATGINASGQLGVGDVTPRSSPVAVLGGLTFQSISNEGAGQSTVFLTTDGAAYACGNNSSGCLGVGDVTPRSSPVAVLGGFVFSKIVSGSTYVFGITTAGALYAWGNNSSGRLGVGDVTSRSSPVAVLGGFTFVDVIISQGSSYALTSDGTMYAWGDNTNGQLGVGDATNRSSPIAVLGGFKFSQMIAGGASGQWVVGLTTTGLLYGWGFNANGQLGVGDVTPRSSPVAVLGGLTFNVLANYMSPLTVADGNDSPVGVATNGKMYAWGVNTNGQLGVGDVVPRSSPVAVLGNLLSTIQDVVLAKDIAVTPGTAYTVTLGQFNASFGNVQIGQGVDELILEWAG